MNLLDSVELELNATLTKMLDLEDQKLVLEAELSVVTEEFNRLNRAYKALTGSTDAPEQASSVRGEEVKDAPVASLVQTPPIPRQPRGPTCNGCGGEMEQGYRTLGNGRTVNLWICRDSGCNNESLA